MTTPTKLDLLVNTKEGLRSKLNLGNEIPFSNYINYINLPTITHLFEDDKQGVVYDPSDLLTLYQNTSGTIPVTKDGDPVGLMLDKSQGLALGSELIKDGSLDAPSSNWTITYNNVNTFSEYVGGRLRFYTVGTNSMYGFARQYVPTIIGTTYKVTVMADALNANVYNQNTATLKAGSSSKTIGDNKAGKITLYFTATSTNSVIDIQGFTGNTDAEVFFDDVSVRELKGNHAAQTLSSARPIFQTGDSRGVVNLVTNSEIFLQSNCVNSSVNAAPGVLSPTGTNNVTRYGPNVDGFRPRYQVGTGNTGTCSIYAKAAESDKILLGTCNSGGYWSLIPFDLTNGVIGNTIQVSNGAIVSNPTMTYVGDGWYRCSVEAITSYGFVVMVADDNDSHPVWSTPPYTGNEGVYIWGAQSEYATTVSQYQPNGTHVGGIGTGKDSDLSWLYFDGVDDALVIPIKLSAKKFTFGVSYLRPLSTDNILLIDSLKSNPWFMAATKGSTSTSLNHPSGSTVTIKSNSVLVNPITRDDLYNVFATANVFTVCANFGADTIGNGAWDASFAYGRHSGSGSFTSPRKMTGLVAVEGALDTTDLDLYLALKSGVKL